MKDAGECDCETYYVICMVALCLSVCLSVCFFLRYGCYGLRNEKNTPKKESIVALCAIMHKTLITVILNKKMTPIKSIYNTLFTVQLFITAAMYYILSLRVYHIIAFYSIPK